MPDYMLTERTITVAAPAQAILPLLQDFRRWQEWSPWEGLDPDLRRTYSGPEHGVGAAYAWAGNRKAGVGNMLVTDAQSESVDIDVNFTKPFKSASKTRFILQPGPEGTRVVWQMRTPKTFMTRILDRFMSFDKSIGADFERGLAEIKRVAESA